MKRGSERLHDHGAIEFFDVQLGKSGLVQIGVHELRGQAIAQQAQKMGAHQAFTKRLPPKLIHGDLVFSTSKQAIRVWRD